MNRVLFISPQILIKSFVGNLIIDLPYKLK